MTNCAGRRRHQVGLVRETQGGIGLLRGGRDLRFTRPFYELTDLQSHLEWSGLKGKEAPAVEGGFWNNRGVTDVDLAKRKCQACEPGTPPMDEDRATELHSHIDGSWERDGNRALRREFSFRNFRDAFGLATRVALVAEQEGHHPDLEIGWGRVVVFLTTHVAGGLTDNDFILAAKIDRIAEGTGMKNIKPKNET